MTRGRWVAMVAVLALVGATRAGAGGRVGEPAPALGDGAWINSAPLTIEGLRGRVVFVEFWTFG